MAECELSTTGRAVSEPPLRVVLVNNMADPALAITERRFQRLVQAACPDTHIDFRCVTIPAIPRGEMAAARIARHYISLDELHAAPPDAILFSGAEPMKTSLHDEIFWPGLTRLLDWVKAENIPSLFSCLAAHAAIYHYAGIARRRMPQKIFGFYTQTITAHHALLSGMPESFTIAHSRWNGIDADQLTAKNYQVLTQNAEIGVDMFVPADGAPHIFLQGHPEYEESALTGEYHRDLKRFEAGESAHKPKLPHRDDCGSSATEGADSTPQGALRAPSPTVNMFGSVIRNWVRAKKEMVA